jgi:hypothetical protein
MCRGFGRRTERGVAPGLRMRVPAWWLGSPALSLVMAAAPCVGQASAQAVTAAPQLPRVAIAPRCSPLNGFVENRGQWPDEVLYFARDRGIALTLLPDALVFRPVPDRETGEWPAPVVLQLPRGVTIEAEGALPTQHNFLLGAIRVSHARGFERVIYRDVVPGLDLAVRVGARGFEYDLLAAPGVDVAELVLAVNGAESLSIEDGVLVMRTPAGRVEQRIGAAWQTDGPTGEQTSVASHFRVQPSAGGELAFSFEAPGREPTRAFVLDPSLVFATYVGGNGQDFLEDMKVTPDGAAYLAARDYANAPTVPWAFQTSVAGEYDAWIGKLSPDGSSLEWGTFLGGSMTEEPFGIDVDADGTVVVAGNTFAPNFPTTAGSLQPVFAGGNDDLFITRLSSDGSALVWSTFYGGASSEIARTMRLFPNGDVLIVALPNAADPPATPGAFDTLFSPAKHLLARISADGADLVWQTYLSGGVFHVLPDGAGDIYFAGAADASFPATRGAFKTVVIPGDVDGVVGKMSGDGSQLYWGTFLGGDQSWDNVVGLARDASGALYLCGIAGSADFPVTQGAFDVASGHAYVAKLLANGTGLVWSTFLTGCCGGTTGLKAIAIDLAGNAIVVGGSNQPNFPTTPGAFQPTYIGSTDGHLTKFDALGESLVYSTYYGGAGGDEISRIGLDGSQDPVLGLLTGSSNLPTTPEAYDKTYGGAGDLAVAKFDLGLLPWKVLGGGLKGAADVPNLAGTGALVPGTPARLSIRGGTPGSSAFLVAGLSELDAPFKGGTMMPVPDILLPMSMAPQGALDLAFSWPAAPPGVVLTVQFWFKSLGEVASWSASNALQLTAQ